MIVMRGPVAETPRNLARVQEYRAKATPEMGNAYPWPHLQREFARFFGQPMTQAEGDEYARQETMDGAYPTTEQYEG